jgi:hypothetical protein
MIVLLGYSLLAKIQHWRGGQSVVIISIIAACSVLSLLIIQFFQKSEKS